MTFTKNTPKIAPLKHTNMPKEFRSTPYDTHHLVEVTKTPKPERTSDFSEVEFFINLVKQGQEEQIQAALDTEEE